MRFWPMTARPMSAMSALGSMFNSVKRRGYDTKVPSMRQQFFGGAIGRLRSELQTWIGFQHRFQVRPARFIHFVEGVQINDDRFRRMFRQYRVHGGMEFDVVHRFG